MMVVFIYINYYCKGSLIIHQSLSQIYQNPPVTAFLIPTTPRCFHIDLNNVSGDTPFHGHSSETELHKPFTTRSLWLMAGPPAKAPGPDGPVKNISRQTRDMLWFLIVSDENTVVIRKGGGNRSKCEWQAQIYNRAAPSVSPISRAWRQSFFFSGVKLPELRLMDWPDAQPRGGQWLKLDQGEHSSFQMKCTK